MHGPKHTDESGGKMKDTPVILAMSFDPVKWLGGEVPPLAMIQKGQKYPRTKPDGAGKRIKYVNMFSAFDIETSTLDIPEEGPQGIMYIWQWQFGSAVTVFGRTWDEFLEVVGKLNKWLESASTDEDEVRLLVLVHNLAYEFQYLAGIWEFHSEDIFATDVRSPLKVMMGNLELRCSYRLSNQSLDSWSHDMQVDHQKLEGFDYSLTRYPWTGLTDDEYRYCFHDVLSVVECANKLLAAYGDSLYTLRLTRTAYIRRRIDHAVDYTCKEKIRDMQNPLYVYDRLRQAFRGGDTHAHPYWCQSILGDVYSYDRSSSYPDVMVHCKFPVTKFREEQADFETFKRLCEKGGRAILVKMAFYKIRLANDGCGDPYISYDGCSKPGYTRPIGEEMDNGRIRSADYIELAMTEIDYRIIETLYDWESVRVCWLMSARYGPLPQPIVDVIIDLYKIKTGFKGVAGKELQYMYAKADLNSCYGMMCQRVISQPILFEHGEWFPDDDFNREEEYAKAIEKTRLNYAWAVWVTAWARWRLFEGIQIATDNGRNPLNFVYCDTDSIKTREPVNLDKYNAARIRDAKTSGAWADDPKGVRHYMGVFESEGKYDAFVTLGAKRYCFKIGDDLVITVAGVPKKAGSEELQRKGGIEAFIDGFIFRESGKLRPDYNDFADFEVEVEGFPLRITRNAVLLPVNYDLSLEKNYALVVATLQDQLDAFEHTDYNVKR